MPAPRSLPIDDVMIAAADLEDAEFERDRLAMACGDVIRQALAVGHTHAQIARAANMSESDVRRLAELPATGTEAIVLPQPEDSGLAQAPFDAGLDATVTSLPTAGSGHAHTDSSPSNLPGLPRTLPGGTDVVR